MATGTGGIVSSVAVAGTTTCDHCKGISRQKRSRVLQHAKTKLSQSKSLWKDISHADLAKKLGMPKEDLLDQCKTVEYRLIFRKWRNSVAKSKVGSAGRSVHFANAGAGEKQWAWLQERRVRELWIKLLSDSRGRSHSRSCLC